MNRTLTAVLILGLLLVQGCAVQGQPFQKAAVPPNNAVIYVYRPYYYAASLVVPPVTCGDETVRIGPGGYHAFTVPPGHITCSVETAETKDEVEIHAQARVYYIREHINYGSWTGHAHLNPVDTDEAQGEIQKCCVLENRPQ